MSTNIVHLSQSQLSAHHLISVLKQTDDPDGLPAIEQEWKEYELVVGEATAIAAVKKQINELASQGYELTAQSSAGTKIVYTLVKTHVVFAEPPVKAEADQEKGDPIVQSA